MGKYIPLLIVLILVAAFFHQDIVFMVVYLLASVYLLGWWWSKHTLGNVTLKRVFVNRATLGQSIPVRLQVNNRGWLPVIWLKIVECLPNELRNPGFFKYVTSLGPYEKAELHYELHARKRGYYSLGPLVLDTSDVLGLVKMENYQTGADHLIVYPKIVPLKFIGLPSRLPFGTIRKSDPIYQDPSRVFNKREYVAGDSLRNIDWKATAVTRKLQVKLYENSVSLQTCLFLNLNPADYSAVKPQDTPELAIVVAASLASWVIRQKQFAGICANGFDPLAKDQSCQFLPPRKGMAQLTQILELLGRIDCAGEGSFTQIFQKTGAYLPWGTSTVLITGKVSDVLIDHAIQAQKKGLSVVIVAVGVNPDVYNAKQEANRAGISLVSIQYEKDLGTWTGILQ